MQIQKIGYQTNINKNQSPQNSHNSIAFGNNAKTVSKFIDESRFVALRDELFEAFDVISEKYNKSQPVSTKRMDLSLGNYCQFKPNIQNVIDGCKVTIQKDGLDDISVFVDKTNKHGPKSLFGSENNENGSSWTRYLINRNGEVKAEGTHPEFLTHSYTLNDEKESSTLQEYINKIIYELSSCEEIDYPPSLTKHHPHADI